MIRNKSRTFRGCGGVDFWVLATTIHFVEELCSTDEFAVHGCALNEGGVPRGYDRLGPRAADLRQSQKLACLLSGIEITAAIMAQDDFLVSLDSFGLRELVEPPSFLKGDAVPFHEVTDVTITFHLHDLEATRRYGLEIAIALESLAWPLAAGEHGKSDIEFAVHAPRLFDLGFPALKFCGAGLLIANRHHKIHRAGELVKRQVATLCLFGDLSVEVGGTGVAKTLDAIRVHAHLEE